MDKVYKDIVSSTKFGVKDKAKRLTYYFSRRRGAKKMWAIRHQKLFSLRESYHEPCNADIESGHQKKWSVFRKRVDMSTIRICKNISGIADVRIIPEDIFISDIEPRLITDESCHFLSHKSFYNQWFPADLFPQDLLHCIEGRYLDAGLNEISIAEVAEKACTISYPVVMKPNKDSFGGKDVFFVETAENLISLCESRDNFVVQEQIKQHDFFSKFNPAGINTIRVYVYRSVSNNVFYILNMALRMGKGGSLDNETSGGIHTRINEDGFLNGYAVDKYGERFMIHPDTGYGFNEQVPQYEELKKLSLEVAQKVFFTRIIGLDVCLDESGQWRVIEVNTKGHTIRFSQYGGQPFFGEFTDEVITYCQNNHWILDENV